VPLDAAVRRSARAGARRRAAGNTQLYEGAGTICRCAAGDLVVACTQEARLFGDIAEDGGKTHDPLL
jgi:hypothetical protein